MAVGAQPQELAIRVTARFFWMLLAGAVTGFAVSMASVRYIKPLLYQVAPTGLRLLLIPMLALMSAAAIAALPAVVRAVKLGVTMLLRAE